MRKIYELRGMNEARLTFNYLNCNVIVEFRNGNVSNDINARYGTDNVFIQDAIESDKRFGKSIRLASVYDEGIEPLKEVPEPTKSPRPKQTKSPFPKRQASDIAEENENSEASVKTLNDVVAYFAAKGETDLTDIEGLKEKYGVSFPNLKK